MVNGIEKYIDYTLLKPDTPFDMFERLCADAEKYRFYSVCVPPYVVKECKKFLKNSKVKITTVIGFPLGYNSTQTKLFEMQKAISDGADETDIVMNVSAFKSGRTNYVLNELKELRKSAGKSVLKIIIESCCLSKEEIAAVCALVSESGADFVKTSTGFGSGGAKIGDIKLIKNSIPRHIKIKASGCIKTLQQAQEFIKAGASRIGTSSLLSAEF
ncbi:MAG: deoxyribose-phosphate aldolase [Endomicrobium sp.]|jgi:deoxyribose-phosphate aldolase|nr:deoxyribose-phosphate aldolase [Endomicrobium sp.]